MKVKNVFTYFTDTILRRNANSYRNPRVRWAVRQYKLLFYTARGLIAHDTIVRSAALTFYTLISIVPILALVFAVVKGFGLLDGLIDDLYALFPQNVEVLDYMVEFARKALANYAGRAYRPGQRRNPFLGRHPGFRVGGERFQQHLGGSVLAQYRPPIPQLHRHRDGRPRSSGSWPARWEVICSGSSTRGIRSSASFFRNFRPWSSSGAASP